MFTKLLHTIIHARMKLVSVRAIGQVLQLRGDASANWTYPPVSIAPKRCAALNSKLGAVLERVHPYRDGYMAYHLRKAEIAK